VLLQNSYSYRFVLTTHQTDLVQVRQAYAEAVASQRRIHRQLDQAQQTADDWYNRAQLALKKQQNLGRSAIDASKYEQLAREALLRREIELEKLSTIQKQFDTQSIATDQLYNGILTLENQIREVMAKQQQLISRARTAEATKQIQSMISGYDTSNVAAAVSNSMNAFARMEQKVEAMEASIEASIEFNQVRWSSPLDSDNGGKTMSRKSLEDEFRVLEQSSKIDEELEVLKIQISGRNGSSFAAIGPAATAVSSYPDERRVVSIPISRGEKIVIP
jgi:phage shock protein A